MALTRCRCTWERRDGRYWLVDRDPACEADLLHDLCAAADSLA